MPVAFRSLALRKWAQTTNSSTVSLPTGTAVDDFLLAILTVGNDPVYNLSFTSPSTPSGWTLVATFTDMVESDHGGGSWVSPPFPSTYINRNHIYTKIADSGDIGLGSVTWINNTTLVFTEITILAFTDVDRVNPISVTLPSALNTTGAGSNTTTTATGITTPHAGTYVIFFGQDWGDTTNTLTAPTSSAITFTQRLTATTSIRQSIATGILASAGATGDATQTSNSTTAHSRGGVLIALQSGWLSATGGSYTATGSTAGENVSMLALRAGGILGV